MSWSSDLDFKLSAFLTKMVEPEQQRSNLLLQDPIGLKFLAMRISADQQPEAMTQESAQKVQA